MSALFYHNEEQKQVALATRDREAASHGAPITTQILPATEFYLAEDYHQKYALRQYSHLMGEFRAMYPEDRDFVNSTAAARINGYLGGNGSPADLQKEIDRFGLSAEGRERLLRAVR